MAAYTLNDNHTRASKPKIKYVTNIIDWVQAFGLHLAIISQKQPQRVPELIGYQALIIDAQRAYLGECWIGYNHHFRQMAPLQAIEKWATTEHCGSYPKKARPVKGVKVCLCV